MRRRLVVPFLTFAFALSASMAVGALASDYSPPASQDAAAVVGSGIDTSSAIVVLKAQPETVYDGHIQGYQKTSPSNGKFNPNSAAAKKYLGYLKNEHSAFAAWLRKNVPSAKITSEFYTALNGVAVKLNGNAIGKLAQNSDVVTVEYNWLYRPSMTQSVQVIKATDVWANAAGRMSAGAGVKVGVIDSGIDYRHPFFSENFPYSAPAGFSKCDAIDSEVGKPDTDCKYVNDKVIVAKTFTNKENQKGYDAMPILGLGDHGTHVSGTVAGDVIDSPTVAGVAIEGYEGSISGVAPGAWLGNYNVFPGDIANARSEDILDAVDAAVNDGMDVITLSLGGPDHGNNDLLAMGLDNVAAGGVVVTVAAGNSGPDPYTIESPGRARNVITVGASTNQHYLGENFTYGTAPTTVGAALGDFPKIPQGDYSLFVTKAGAGTGLNDACASLPMSTKSDELALVTRGTCAFSVKVRNSHAAGYAGVLVRNNSAGDPIAMGTDGLGNDQFAAVMVSMTQGDTLAADSPATISTTGDLAEVITNNADFIAGFSSTGPTRVNNAIKPDLTSVGVNVLSSIPCAGDGVTLDCGAAWAFYQGTSMATPHVAGSAAVLLALHSDWTVAQVKSALVNTADNSVKTSVGAATATVEPMKQGAGREDLYAANGATISFSPVSASFGKISASKNNPTTFTITLSNSTATSESFTLSNDPYAPTGQPGIEFPATVTVPGDGSATLDLAIPAGLANGTIVQGWITLAGDSGSYHFAYWAQVAP